MLSPILIIVEPESSWRRAMACELESSGFEVFETSDYASTVQRVDEIRRINLDVWAIVTRPELIEAVSALGVRTYASSHPMSWVGERSA